MIIEFSTENFLSIKDRVTFSMLTSADKEHHENYFYSNSLPKNQNKLLKVAVVYGANASGKTNLFESLSFLKFLVLHSHQNQKGDEFPTAAFKLDENCLSEPSKFEISFVHKDVRYLYGLTISTKEVIEEYLHYWPNNKIVTIFERKKNNKFNLYKKPQNDKEKLRQEILQEQTLKNILYISQATKLKDSEISKAFDWFKYQLRILVHHSDISHVTSQHILNDKKEKTKESILKYLSNADFSIVDLHCNKIEKELDEFPAKIKEFFLSEISNKFPSTTLSEANKISISNIEEKMYHLGSDSNGNKKIIEFDIEEESAGTKKFYELIGPVNQCLEKGYTLFVDELDLRLHPILTRFLINLFQSSKSNPYNAQLIFTTHNVDILDLSIMRRDQIWFTNKKRNGGYTELNSLNEFKVRKDLNIRKGYLQGRFGGIPLILEES